MKVIGEGEVELTRDEQIIGDFFAHLVEERGMSRAEAVEYLRALSGKVPSVLTEELQMYSMAFEMAPGKAPRHALPWGTTRLIATPAG